MKTLIVFACLAATWVNAGLIEYQGRVRVENQLFSGQGHFCFAVVDETGQPLWTSGALPREGDLKLLDDALKLSVTNGVFHVRLGETRNGQPALDEVEILTTPGCKLRIWFNDGTNGWHRAGDDVPLDDVLRESRAKFITSDQAETILRGLRGLRMRLERENARAAAAAEKAKASAETNGPAGAPKP